jgi:hypothetical protein
MLISTINYCQLSCTILTTCRPELPGDSSALLNHLPPTKRCYISIHDNIIELVIASKAKHPAAVSLVVDNMVLA